MSESCSPPPSFLSDYEIYLKNSKTISVSEVDTPTLELGGFLFSILPLLVHFVAC